MPTPLLDNLRRRGELYRIAGPTGEQYDDDFSEVVAKLTFDILPDAIGIDASNVTTWMGSRGPEADQLDVVNEPGLRCPWSAAWIEWDWGNDPLVIDSWPVKRGAMLAYTADDGDINHRVVEAAAKLGIDNQDRHARQYIEAASRLHLLGPYLPWPGSHGAVVGPWGSFVILLDPDGQQAPGTEHEIFCFAMAQRITRMAERDSGKAKDAEAATLIGAATALRAFQFANCQNVALVEVQPQLSRQQRRLNERTGEPVNTWHELRIGAIGGRRSEGGAQPTQGLVRQHICRGHFATYTEERKLFGKYAGRFWVPATVKGNPERGRSDKGYVVEVPNGK